MQFVTDLGKLETSMFGVLQRVDRTFERKEGQNETAINAWGFEVDFRRHQPEGDDPQPFRFSDDEGDLWQVQAVRASVRTTAQRFDHVVLSATGRMALMQTIAPRRSWSSSAGCHEEPSIGPKPNAGATFARPTSSGN